MATLTHLDTHVVVWVVAGEHNRLSDTARDALEHDTLRISPMVALELTYLHEVGRITETSDVVLDEARRSLGLVSADEPFGDVIDVATGLEWTRDPFDRIIAAHALVARARLLTRDETVHAHLDLAVW